MTNLIPLPSSIAPTHVEFVLPASAQVLVSPANDETLRVANFLADELRAVTGYALPVVPDPRERPDGSIFLALHQDSSLGDEGYELNVTNDRIVMRAAKAAGLFYGVQTLRQLVPLAPQGPVSNPAWHIPTAGIRDIPRFAWRGVMLDVARHFFPVETVKQYMDWLALYKLNRLHLHLSDDQGWRIEIKSWEKLAAVGGSSGVDGKNSGYYSQEDYRDLVAYAAERYITVVPEIDTPGHTNAALASYPELNCDGVAPQLYTGTQVGFSSLCVDSEITYQFLDDVIRELAAMTPGDYIHLGGDEAHATDKVAYTQFVERIEPIVQKYGKRMIGWEEIAQAEISPQTIAQNWRGEHAAQAVRQGARIIHSPAKHAYLDMQYHDKSPLGLHWAAFIEARDAYEWDPAAEEEGIPEQAILGVEAPLWSETLLTLDDLAYMTFPRLTAIAEIGWSPQAARAWDSYRVRVAAHGVRWDRMGINYYRSPQIPWEY